MADPTVDAIVAGAWGAGYFVVGHGNPNLWGSIKEVLAIRSAAGKEHDGPAKEMISSAYGVMTSSDSHSPSADTKDRSSYVRAGSAGIDRVVAVLPLLEDAQAEHVRRWLLGIAEGAANAAKDKGGGDRVSEQERGAIDELSRRLAG